MSETTPSTEAATPEAPAATSDDLLASLDAAGSVVGDAKADGEQTEQSQPEGDKAEGEGDADKAKSEDGKPQAGAPETYDLKMPEGVALDEAAWKVAEPVFKEANIGPEQAQKLAEAFPDIVKSITDRGQAAQVEQIATIRKEWADQVKADPEMGGANYDANLSLVAKARDAFLRPDDVQFLKDTGLGNSPMMFHLLLGVGKAISEGAIHSGTAPATQMSGSEKMYGPGWGPKA